MTPTEKGLTPMEVDDKSTVSKDEDSKKKEVKKNKEEEMNEEDTALKEGLELAVTRLTEDDASLHKPSLEHLIKEIREATSSMTSVPKPLKFLRPHYQTLKTVYEAWPAAHEMKELMADVLSVLAMTMAESGSRECLKYKLEGTKKDIANMGQEYLRSLSGEIALEYIDRAVNQGLEEPEVDDLMVLVDDIIPFQMKHNAETEAVDLLLEVQKLDKLLDPSFNLDDRNFERVCLYLVKTADYIADPDDIAQIYSTTYDIYLAQGKYTGALRVALKMDDHDRIRKLFSEETGASVKEKRQMSYLLGRHKSSFRLEDGGDLDEIIGNTTLADTFKAVARDLDVSEPKLPEDIFKSHLQEGGLSVNRMSSTGVVDSNMHNLASSFVNGFVNAGIGSDKLMTVDDSTWARKVKAGSVISAVASMGLVLLWDAHEGLNQFDKYLSSTEFELKAGACLGIGMLCSGVDDEDMAFSLLSEYINSNDPMLRIASTCGLGLSYAGQRREDLVELLEDTISSSERSVAEISLSALSLGFVHVGNCDEDVGTMLMSKLMEMNDTQLDDNMSRFLCLGLGLLYLGRTERCEAMLEAVKTIEHNRGKFAQIVLEACAYAGTGNVLQIQQMLRVCAEHISEPDKAQHQMAAVIGIALVALGEDVGTEMCLRAFDHLLHYGEIPVKRSVPLALALLYVSNPDYTVADQLSRLSHDADKEVAMNAIFGLGMISAGTNNSRVAGMLRQLSEFYAKDTNVLFVVRIAQGLLGLAKGLCSLNPFHSDRLLMIETGTAGLLTALFCCLDMKTVLDKYHYLLYFLVPAMNPRFIATIDESNAAVPLNIRVGQRVEIVGQAGRPKTISGFQTHTTPVLLGYMERAELANSEYSTPTSILEGVVIVEKNETEEGTEMQE